jgi:hypothetical protein
MHINLLLSQHLPSPHSQATTSWLLSGEQPQAPIMHVSGKSETDLQHDFVVTFPKEFTHPLTFAIWPVALHIIEGIRHFGVL